MQTIKTFRTGQVLTAQIEGGSAVAYIDAVRAGWIRPMFNLDADGRKTKPQVVAGKTLVALVEFGGKQYWLVDGEYAPVQAMIDLARATREAAEHAAYVASAHGKARAERARKAREWDDLNNDGGDGYNPYRNDDDVTGTAFDRRERHYPGGA